MVRSRRGKLKAVPSDAIPGNRAWRAINHRPGLLRSEQTRDDVSADLIIVATFGVRDGGLHELVARHVAGVDRVLVSAPLSLRPAFCLDGRPQLIQPCPPRPLSLL